MSYEVIGYVVVGLFVLLTFVGTVRSYMKLNRLELLDYAQ